MNISILIPVHNNLRYTKICLSNLTENIKRTKDVDNIKIIIIDDGSTDGTSDWINISYPSVHLLRGDGNLWWSGAMNLGLKYAFEKLKSDYILLWNNDLIADDDYFINLRSVLLNNNNKTIICSKVYFMDRPNIIYDMGGYFNPRTGKMGHIGGQKADNEKYNSVLEVDWSGGQGVAINKNVFTGIGYFDESTFPQYFGDADFSLRAKKNGFQILSYPNLRIWNDVSNSGIHVNDFKSFIKSFYSLRSHNNIYTNIKFYNRHSTSYFTYYELIKRYFFYVRRFIYRWILNLLGINIKSNPNKR